MKDEHLTLTISQSIGKKRHECHATYMFYTGKPQKILVAH